MKSEGKEAKQKQGEIQRQNLANMYWKCYYEKYTIKSVLLIKKTKTKKEANLPPITCIGFERKGKGTTMQCSSRHLLFVFSLKQDCSYE